MILTKTVEENDYTLIKTERLALEKTLTKLNTDEVRIDLGHPHRLWEYGMAMHAFMLHSWSKIRTSRLNVLDVGAGVGLLGPTIMYQFGLGFNDNEEYVELEPDTNCRPHREKLNTWLDTNQRNTIKLVSDQLNSNVLAGTKFNAVFCISVIEHIAADHEFLRMLSDKVEKGGLLFLTTDVMPRMPKENGKPYHFDNLREHNYTMYDVCAMMDYLRSIGFKSFGDVDVQYKGDQVFDYSFASICMTKS